MILFRAMEYDAGHLNVGLDVAIVFRLEFLDLSTR